MAQIISALLEYFSPFHAILEKGVNGMKRVAIGILFVILLGGCAAIPVKPACRVVTGIQVQYQQQGNTLYRTYNQEETIQPVLYYLRTLRPLGPVIPEETFPFTCLFTLQYSHGPDSVILQQGYDYLRRNEGNWKQIDDSQAQLLYTLLLLLPSDQ